MCADPPRGPSDRGLVPLEYDRAVVLYTRCMQALFQKIKSHSNQSTGTFAVAGGYASANQITPGPFAE